MPRQGFIDVPGGPVWYRTSGNGPSMPVLVMTGGFDEARPETVAGFQKLVPGAQFTVIMDAGHSTLSKKPDEYRSVLEDFLESVERRQH